MSAATKLIRNASDRAARYLTVVIANETYGIAVLKVREIIRLQKITPVPQAPKFVRGVINLRGRVIPIIDLRVKFGVEAPFTDRTCIVVAQVSLSASTSVYMGMIVDAVEEVLSLNASEIEPPPDFGVQIDAEYILGMATVKGGVKTLLDIDRVVSAGTAQLLAERAAETN
jgi:purine-binding chemotaxis protein CheW